MDDQDQEWLESVNSERKKEQLDKVTYEVFEIIMDRLEKEWFSLVRMVAFFLLQLTHKLLVRPRPHRSPTRPCLQKTPLALYVTMLKVKIVMPSSFATAATWLFIKIAMVYLTYQKANGSAGNVLYHPKILW
jgi:hypothetical protein